MIETCPSREHLEAYCLGHLTAVQADELELHLGTCEDCDHRISTIESAVDEVVAGIRQARLSPPVGLDSEVQSLIQRAQQLSPPGSTRIDSDTDSGRRSIGELDPQANRSSSAPDQRESAADGVVRLIESAAALRDQLISSGVATEAEASAWQAEFESNTTGTDALAFAQSLIRQKRLTLFQARMLLFGRGDELRLDDYVILDELGHGGMGVVVRARHLHMSRNVAIKMLADRLFDQAEMTARFQREIRTAASLSHPHVVTAYDARESHGRHYLAMELVDGIDLNALVKQQHPLALEAVVDFVRQAAEGLAAAHDVGLVHRDVKPSNLLVSQNGMVKVADLGLARSSLRQQDDERLTESGIVLGTLDYLAPEQAFDPSRVDGRADIYGLGWTLYYLLNGQLPHQDRSRVGKLLSHRDREIPPLSDERQGIPPALNELFRQMVAKQPSDRPENMRVICETLAGIQEKIGRPSSLDIPVPEPAANLAGELEELARTWQQACEKQRGSLRSPLRKPRRAAILLAALSGLLILAAIYATSTMRMQSTGELAIQVNEESQTEVAVKVINASGEEDFTFDASHGWRGDLLPGRYRLELVRGATAFELESRVLDVAAGRFYAVTVTPKPREPDPPLVDEPLIADPPTEVIPGEIAKVEIAPQVHRLALSPAGDIGFAAFGRNIYIVDLLSRKVTRMIAGHQKVVGHLACSPDDTYFASCSADRTVCVWDAADYERIARIKLPVIPLRASFSPDGSQLIIAVDVASRDLSLPPNSPENFACQSLMMFESRTGRRLAQLTRDRDSRYSALAFSPAGKLVAAASMDGQIVLIDVEKGKETLRLQTTVKGPVQDIQFAADGASFYTIENGETGKSNLVVCRDVDKGKERSRWPLDFAASRLDVSPDGRRFLLSDFSDLTVLDAATSRTETLLGHEGLISDVYFRREGRQAVTAGRDGTIRLWQLPSQEEPMAN